MTGYETVYNKMITVISCSDCINSLHASEFDSICIIARNKVHSLATPRILNIMTPKYTYRYYYKI